MEGESIGTEYRDDQFNLYGVELSLHSKTHLFHRAYVQSGVHDSISVCSCHSTIPTLIFLAIIFACFDKIAQLYIT